MLMPGNVPVKTLGGTGRFQTADFAAVSQKIKVAVHSAQADARQALAYNAIELIGSGMALGFA